MSEENSIIPQPRLRCIDREQINPCPRRIEDMVEKSHQVRTIWSFVKGLDLSELYSQIKSIEGRAGSPAIDPKILMALWLYATIDHETSSRRIAILCKEHVAYIWLCGGVNVNHHTLSDFYTSHDKWLDNQFTLHLTSLMEQGLVNLSRVAQDGMKVRASAGAASFRRKETLEENLQKAEKHMEQLRQERVKNPIEVNKYKRSAKERAAQEYYKNIEEAIKQLPEVEKKKKEKDRKKARVSTTDPDARVMKMPDGGFRPAYNIQLSTDTDSQIILGVNTVNAGNDQGQLSPMLEQIKKRMDKFPDEALVDGGFVNQEEISYCEDEKIILYAPVPKPKDETRDPYQPLPKDSQSVANWRKRMGTDEAKEIYKERAATAECVNAIARNRGLRQFSVRGIKKVRTAVLWFVLAHNLLREASLRLEVA